ncbi:MAG: restriction endonuclease subunit S [Flavobacteriaceae bacterium]|nr:restriction endonuclease subunit S [Flavobacteriaceae bacterium]
MSWKTETFGSLLTESRIPCENPDIEKRIRVKLNVQGVEKRPVGAEKEGATKQFVRKAGQFIYGKQNFHKGAFGVIPEELDGFETSADIPSFDVREDCLPEWIYYFFKAGNRYLELTEFARGVGSQRIHPKQLQDLEIPLPPVDVQRKIIAELEIIEKDEISPELTHQLDLVKQLRQAFLREAMQGKLVPQDENDKPASALLEKIKAEKERLIKEKKIKKQKPLPPITEDEIPFEIPENWVWCRLGDSGELKRGKSKHRPRNDERLFKSGEYPFIQTGDVARSKSNGYIIRTIHGYYNDFGLAQSEMQPIGTLCITIAANIAECGFLGFDACAPDSIVCYNSLDKTTEKYAFYYLIDARVEIEKYAPATAQKNINLGILNSLLVPLPPLSEQQRIVTKLDELMAYCDELEDSIKESQQQNELLLQQVLREALEPKEKNVYI